MENCYTMINPYDKSNAVTKIHVVDKQSQNINEMLYIKCLVKLSDTEKAKKCIFIFIIIFKFSNEAYSI